MKRYYRKEGHCDISIRFCSKRKDARYYWLNVAISISKTKLMELASHSKISFKPIERHRDNPEYMELFRKKRNALRAEIKRRKNELSGK